MDVAKVRKGALVTMTTTIPFWEDHHLRKHIRREAGHVSDIPRRRVPKALAAITRLLRRKRKHNSHDPHYDCAVCANSPLIHSILA